MAMDEQDPKENLEKEQIARDESSRLDQTKAFFRAMYAGGEPDAANMKNAEGLESAACVNCQGLEAQLAESEKRASEAEGLYKRMAADFDNYRRRVEREREEFQATGVQKAIESLLPALDDMDRAQSSLNPGLPAEKLIESLNLVFNRITRSLEQIGVKPMSVIGEHFDPKFHEPVQEVHTSDFPDGAVMQELRRGYVLNDKVIRPALVNVATNPAGCDAAESSGSQPDKVYDLSEFDDSEDESRAGQGEVSS